MKDDPRIREILDRATDLPAAQRPAFLDDSCGDDVALRAEVDSLLHALDEADEFLVSPTVSAQVRDQSPATDILGTMIGPYKLIEKIGEGGMGVVYKAEQTEPVCRQVALKIIKPGMDTGAVIARFGAERQALAMMDHGNIARVLDASSTQNGRPYFVMELVAGVSVTRYCDENLLTPAQRLTLFIPICQAVQHAHQKGIIHRDLKPGNILVSVQDGKAVVKVIDFGIARAIEQTDFERTAFTEAGNVVGTPEYMSPEQAGGRSAEIDTRSDVYALGVILYELLTGATPLDREQLYTAGFEQMMRTIREVEPPRPSTRLSTLGKGVASASALRQMEPRKLARMLVGDLDLIVMKCLEKDRARRYETASGLARDIERFLSGDPVEATPPSAVYAFRKFARKYRKTLSAAAALALVVVGCLATTSVVFWVLKAQAMHDRDIAETARIGERNAKEEAVRQEHAAEQERQFAEQQQQLAVQQRKISDQQKALAEAEAYRASIFAAGAAVNSDNPSSANWFLSQAPSRFTNWEWNYLHAAVNPQLATIRFNGNDRIYYFPERGEIVEFDGDLSVSFLDPGTRKVKRRLLSLQAQRLRPLAMSSDGQRFVAQEVSGKNAGALHVLGPQGEMIASIPKSRQSATYDYTTTFTKDHSKFITAAVPDEKIQPAQLDHPLRVWETDTGRMLMQLDIQCGPLCSAAFSPDESRLVTASWDGVSQVWDMSNGRCISTYRDSCRDFTNSGFSPDGKSIVSSSRSMTKLGVIWTPTSPDATVKLVIPEGTHITDTICACFSPDGKMIGLSGGKFAAVFDAENAAPIAEFRGQTNRVPGISFIDGGSRVLTSSNDNNIWIWELKPKPNPLVFGGKGLPRVMDAQFSADSQTAVIRSDDGVVRTYNLGTGELAHTLDPNVLRTQFSHLATTNPLDSATDQIAVPCRDGTVFLCDERTGEVRGRVGDAHDGPFPVVTAFMHDGKHAITGSANGAVRVWDLTGTTPPWSISDKGEAVEKIIVSPLDDRAITVSHQGNGKLWDLKLRQFKTDFTGPATSFAFSHNGRRIVTGQGMGTDFYDNDGKPQGWMYSHVAKVLSARFNADDSKVLVSYDNEIAEIWEARPGGHHFATLVGHQGKVVGASYNQDESRVVTCSLDGTAGIWETSTGNLLLSLHGHTNPVIKAEFSPDGRKILTVSEDGTARVWDSVSEEQRAQQSAMSPGDSLKASR